LETLQSLTPGAWLNSFRNMINSIKLTLTQGRAMLVRVGRHCGAESVTLDRRRWIQIRGGRGQSHWARYATTIWLAAEREDSSSEMRPFGWLLVEPPEGSPPAILEDWCNEEKERLNRSPDAHSPPGGGPATAGVYRFRKGDRVTNGEEEATAVRDVRSADARMDVRYDDGEIEEVSVAAWRIAR
jgi:CRISPR-associated protein Csm5